MSELNERYFTRASKRTIGTQKFSVKKCCLVQPKKLQSLVGKMVQILAEKLLRTLPAIGRLVEVFSMANKFEPVRRFGTTWFGRLEFFHCKSTEIDKLAQKT